MLSDEALEKIVERLVDRIEEANAFILKQIGTNIKKAKTLGITDRLKLEQILKYGGDYEKIVQKIAEITKLNIADIKKIFREVAKIDYRFAKQFYNYRGQRFIPWEENLALQQRVDALANITAQQYLNFANTRTIGFSIKDATGKTIFQNLDDTYIKVMDEAIWNISQGTSTFNDQMRLIMNQLGSSGIKYLDYENGRKMRLDSAVRMHVRGALRSMHNDLQEQWGKEFNADGVEISVHSSPAPDHALVQGRQFTTNQYDEYGNLIKEGEFEKFQSDEDAVSYDGIEFPAEFEGHDRRSISQYNCYHYIFSIILGVSKPAYTNEQLRDIINRSKETFEFDGKEYTMYEATQLQRQLETAIRKQKDIQIIGRASDDKELIGQAQSNITKLTRKYKQLSDVSGLPTKNDRLRVSGYKRVKV